MKAYRSSLILVVALLSSTPAYADFIRIENIGSIPISGIYFRFEFPPYDGSPGTIFLTGSPGQDEFTYFRDDIPTIADPLLVGQTIDTYRIPELTGMEYALHQVGINHLPPVGDQYGHGMSGHFPITPDVTVIDLVTEGFPLSAQFSYLSGGNPRPHGPPFEPPGSPPWVPEPSTITLLGIGIVGLIGYGRRRGR